MLFEHLLVLLTAIWISRKIFTRLRLPTLFGEIFAGFLVGPMVLGWVAETEAIRVLAELGIFFLMFHAGLEFTPENIFKSFKSAFWVALAGMLLPFVSLLLFSFWYGFDAFVSVFIALVLSVSSLEISARMFKEQNLGRMRLAQRALMAAILTEIILLMGFSVYLDVFQTRSFDLAHLLLLCSKVLAYFLIVFWIGKKGSHYLHRFLYKGNKGFTLSLIIALAFSVFAELIGLHFIIGAFLAGLFLQKELLDIEMYDKLEDRVFGLSYSFLGPIFFASLAFHLDLFSMVSMPVFFVSLFLVSVVTKVLGSGLPMYLRRKKFLDALAVGVSMNTRGALALIFASIGYEEGIISAEMFSLLVIVILSATLLSLIVFKPLSKQIEQVYGQD